MRKRPASPPEPISEAEMADGVPCPLCEYYGHTPNAETIAAIEEGRAMSRGEIPGKRYDSVEEMLRDLRD